MLIRLLGSDISGHRRSYWSVLCINRLSVAYFGGNIGYQGFHSNVNQYGQVLEIAGYIKLRHFYSASPKHNGLLITETS